MRTLPRSLFRGCRSPHRGNASHEVEAHAKKGLFSGSATFSQCCLLFANIHGGVVSVLMISFQWRGGCPWSPSLGRGNVLCYSCGQRPAQIISYSSNDRMCNKDRKMIIQCFTDALDGVSTILEGLRTSRVFFQYSVLQSTCSAESIAANRDVNKSQIALS